MQTVQNTLTDNGNIESEAWTELVNVRNAVHIDAFNGNYATLGPFMTFLWYGATPDDKATWTDVNRDNWYRAYRAMTLFPGFLDRVAALSERYNHMTMQKPFGAFGFGGWGAICNGEQFDFKPLAKASIGYRNYYGYKNDEEIYKDNSNPLIESEIMISIMLLSFILI